MLQVVDLVNKIIEKKEKDLRRSFLFNDLINEMCQYDPSRYEEVHDTFTSTKDINVYTSDGNDITD